MSPGIWEMMSQGPQGILIGIPSVGTVTIDWALEFRGLALPVGTQIKSWRGLPIDVARNRLVKDAREMNAKYLFFLDSIPDYTPVMIRDKNKQVDVLPISDLVEFKGDGLERVPVDDLEVREDKSKWVKVKAIIRHPFEGQLKRIRARSALLDVSPNHSVYTSRWNQNDRTCNLTDAAELIPGQRLALNRPSSWNKRTFFLGREDLAWLYGFFAAEGSICHNKDGENKIWRVSNSNYDLIQKAQGILEDYFNRASHIVEEKKGDYKPVYHLQTGNAGIANFFEDNFYTKSGQKKVPKIILNAPTRIKLEFLRGYNVGDGYTNPKMPTLEFYAFTTTSPTLAEGLLYLLSSVGQTSYSIQSRLDKLNAIQISINRGLYEERGKAKSRGEIKSIDDIEYNGYLYDLSTETERFCGGVGGCLLHNSDEYPERPTAIQELLSLELPIVSGLYWSKKGVPAMWMPTENELTFQAVSQFPESSLIEVGVLGAGCLLIDMRVFDKIPPPWFKWEIDDPALQEGKFSEDFNWCIKARAAGFKIHVHTGIRFFHEQMVPWSAIGQVTQR